jgi:hypothetical protein
MSIRQLKALLEAHGEGGAARAATEKVELVQAAIGLVMRKRSAVR